MKRMVVGAMICGGLSMPLVVAAQGDSMMGGANRGSMMGGGTAMMGGDLGTASAAGSPGLAGMSDGEVRKVDGTAGKLTLRHGPLVNLDMPGMTMVFRVRDPAWLAQLKVGDKVRFVAERVDGNLTVTALEPGKQ